MTENIEWVRETMHQFGEQLGDIRRDMADVRERLIRMEASTVHNTVEKMEGELRAALARIDTLEAAKDHKDGMERGIGKTADLLYKLAPWLFATGITVLSNWQHLFGGVAH